jgi:hypothetical protein
VRIVICTNFNGIGLETDARLLEGVLQEWGHEVARAQYDQANSETFDLCIWLEVFNTHLLCLAPRHYIFCNPEWTKPENIRSIQRHCERVFAKTRDGEKSLRDLFPNVMYTGFLTEDRNDPLCERLHKCLHIGGNSGFRGTAEVIATWREYRYWDDNVLPELTVVTNSKMISTESTPGVTFHKRVSDEEIKQLQNSHLFHLYPSAYEGWGQALHEAQSVGAVILTTRAGPMQELMAPFEVPAISSKRNNLGVLYEVSPRDIRERVPEMLKQPSHEIARMSLEARMRFEQGNKAFRATFKGILEASERVQVPSGTPKPPERPRIALLGNFGPPHSTENELLWSLRDMGYPVTTFQENEDRTEDILEGCKGAALLIYIHTHQWLTPGRLTLDELWEALKLQGTKTASFHLDRYWGLNQLDQREDKIGSHAFWRTGKIFTADGGNQERFSERGIEHHWLPPGVVKRDCYSGEWRKDLAIDVGFVGAEGYHPEYPFRGELLSFLRSVYGERFRVFQGYRGQHLNDVYASGRVFVGDSCFGGSDYYWSDRVPETCGRGGLLCHPGTRGLSIPGLVTFTPGNLYELQDRIDWWLDHEQERNYSRHVAQTWVRENETYSNRMMTLLQKMGIV